MLKATRRFTFDSMHVLPNHPGKCSRPHGHTYILEVTVGPGFDDTKEDLWQSQGFFVDFGDLKAAVGKVLENWDHHNLNYQVDPYPTAERLILHLWKQISQVLPRTCSLRHLRLHETPNNWIEYDGHDEHFSHIVIPETHADPKAY